jgi:hypothetical protein
MSQIRGRDADLIKQYEQAVNRTSMPSVAHMTSKKRERDWGQTEEKTLPPPGSKEREALRWGKSAAGVASASGLTENFHDETRRKCFSSGQFIPPNIEYFSYYSRELGLADHNETAQQILKRLGPEAGFGSTPQEFIKERDARIDKYVEDRCIPLVKHLLDQGKVTTSANAYNDSHKGVFWFDPADPGQQIYFTTLDGKKTYPTTNAGIDFDAETKHDFSAYIPSFS